MPKIHLTTCVVLCRRFLLEWLSFLYRYVPVGLLEVVPQCMQWRPPAFFGRSDLETLLARYLPSVFLSVFLSHAFCLLSNILCNLHLLLPRLLSPTGCARHRQTLLYEVFAFTNVHVFDDDDDDDNNNNNSYNHDNNHNNNYNNKIRMKLMIIMIMIIKII